MEEWEVKKILILVKTYPSPSEKYQEVVCTAGIADTGELVRIYPVKYRYLNDNQKFEKFRWIEAKVKKNPQDNRPESYKVQYESIKLLNRIESKDAEERLRWLLPVVSSSMESVRDNKEKDGVTLGLFKPKEITDLTVKESDSLDWTDKEKLSLFQLSFGENEAVPLEKIPYDFSLKFRCDDERCTGHDMKITDWEICQAYRNFTSKYGKAKGIEKLKEKYSGMFADPNTNTYAIVGTVRIWGTFIIIGISNVSNRSLLYPQLSMFDG